MFTPRHRPTSSRHRRRLTAAALGALAFLGAIAAAIGCGELVGLGDYRDQIDGGGSDTDDGFSSQDAIETETSETAFDATDGAIEDTTTHPDALAHDGSSTDAEAHDAAPGDARDASTDGGGPCHVGGCPTAMVCCALPSCSGACVSDCRTEDAAACPPIVNFCDHDTGVCTPLL